MTENLKSRADREAVHVWVAIFVSLAFSVTAISLRLEDLLEEFCQRHSCLPLAQWAMTAFLIWLLSLLWVAHRNWQRSLVRQEVRDVPQR